jgi:hypothetical protein
MKTMLALLALGAFAGCADTTSRCCLIQNPSYPPPHPPAPPPAEATAPSSLTALPATHILVLQSTHTDRLTEVVGVIDVHAEMGGQDAALELLKARAAQLGADAVLGVEFHHGHGEDEPTHLSGLAVRFIDAVR